MTKTTKRALRAKLKPLLANISAATLAEASNELEVKIDSLIKNLPDRRDTVLLYVPTFPGEFRILGESLNRTYAIFLPQCAPDSSPQFIGDARVHTSLWSSCAPRRPPSGSFSLADTTDSKPLTTTSPPTVLTPDLYCRAVAIVPALAFTACGYRLGRGSGFYDRFLPGFHQHQGYSVGICWHFQLFSSLPLDPHDQAVSTVLSMPLVSTNSQQQTER